MRQPRCGSGTVRLQAACQTEPAYVLLMERSARQALGLVLPDPEQDQAVARLWARPHDACPVPPAHPRCARLGR
jgi:hypothetical protein